MSEQGDGKEAWGSRIGVILAVTGSAVGLGNFLRFPGLAAKYDGGAFMIPYFVAFLLLGLPICWVEWSMGRYGGIARIQFLARHLPRRLAQPGRPLPGRAFAGGAGDDLHVLRLRRGWCLAYAVRYLAGHMDFGTSPAEYRQFFDNFVGKAGDGQAFSTPGEGLLGSAMFFLALCFVINFVLIYRGLTKGIEWFCKWAMPALIVCALIVLVRVLTLGTPDPAKPDQSLLNGLGFMWNPSTTRITLLGVARATRTCGWKRPGRSSSRFRSGFGIDHHLCQLPAQGRRHRPVEPDGGGGQRVLRGGPGRADHHSRRLRVPGLRRAARIRPPLSNWASSRCPTCSTRWRRGGSSASFSSSCCSWRR